MQLEHQYTVHAKVPLLVVSQYFRSTSPKKGYDFSPIYLKAAKNSAKEQDRNGAFSLLEICASYCKCLEKQGHRETSEAAEQKRQMRPPKSEASRKFSGSRH